MQIIGIIVEYNPFHYGHLHHLEETKKKYPDSLIVAIMSGHFCQRGEPSVINKWDKTKIAIQYGIDLVIELPFIFSTQSADVFARSSIELLKASNVEILIFGSECNNSNYLKEKALQAIEFEKNINIHDKSLSYPKAIGQELDIKSPNDILGICYIKEVIKQKAHIKVETIKRTNDFHSNSLKSKIVSASAIRNALQKKQDIKDYVPNDVYKTLQQKKIFIDDFFNILKYKILTEDLSIYQTVDEGIENRLKKAILNSHNINELIANSITKRYTITKIQRMFIHIVCNLTKKEVKRHKKNEYIRILGFNKVGQKYLNKIKKKTKLPIVVKFNNCHSPILAIEYRVAKIYSFISDDNNLIKQEYQNDIKKY